MAKKHKNTRAHWSGIRHSAEVFEVCILASGSEGNAMLLRTRDAALLIDAGLSGRKLSERLQRAGVMPDQLLGVVLTHEHGDHTGALRTLGKKHGWPIYCNSATAHALKDSGLQDFAGWRYFQTGQPFSVGPWEIESFSVPHDAIDPVGFVIRCGAGSLGVLTDLGHFSPPLVDRMREVHTLVIEANYDEELLEQDQKRPWSVKQRIASKHGHLSNRAVADFVSRIGESNLRRVILGHLSRDCNRPDLALAAARAQVSAAVALYCAEQEQISPFFLAGEKMDSEVRGELVDQVNPVGAQNQYDAYTQSLLF